MAHVASKDRRDRREILDRLEELPPLTSFVEGEQTPTSGTASLPTPNNGDSMFAYHIPYTYIRNDGWLCTAPDEEGDDEERDELTPLQPPAAPMMKDLDSFTEGTGRGSFDSIPAADTDQLGRPIHLIDSLSLLLLPDQDDLSDIVERWRVQVAASLSPTLGNGIVKRRRSPTPDAGRRTRPRSWSLGSTFQRPRRFARRCSSLPRSLSALSECEPPD